MIIQMFTAEAVVDVSAAFFRAKNHEPEEIPAGQFFYLQTCAWHGFCAESRRVQTAPDA